MCAKCNAIVNNIDRVDETRIFEAIFTSHHIIRKLLQCNWLVGNERKMCLNIVENTLIVSMNIWQLYIIVYLWLLNNLAMCHGRHGIGFYQTLCSTQLHTHHAHTTDRQPNVINATFGIHLSHLKCELCEPFPILCRIACSYIKCHKQ